MIKTLTLLSVAASALAEAERPIIGIYTHPSTSSADDCGGSCDYLAASYVKWIESAGGRAVPIPYHASDAHLDALLAGVNGVLFPGGDAELPSSAKYVYAQAQAFNDAGSYFPLWGTCLGFEWLLELSGATLDNGFDSENISLALDFADADVVGASRLFADASQATMDILSGASGENVTMNNHVSGITPDDFAEVAGKTFTLLSRNVDRQGKAFVSTMEAAAYPFYGTQWHPEKNNFEFGYSDDGSPYEVINHSADAVAASQYVANFLVDEARKSDHAYPTAEDEQAALIYNYRTTAGYSKSFVEEYFFTF